MKIRNLAVLAAIVLQTACSSSAKKEFGCAGMPEGVNCKTPKEVYAMTNGEDWRYLTDPEKAAAFREAQQRRANAPPVDTGRQMALPPGSAEPVLEPAQTMRVWVSPWVDRNQDLHWPEVVFTEITPRRWSFGESPVRRNTMLVPTHMENGFGPSMFAPPPGGLPPGASESVYEEMRRRNAAPSDDPNSLGE